ncbi:MAG: carotenoid oxygenase family protein [Parasphingorhabdus sp.]
MSDTINEVMAVGADLDSNLAPVDEELTLESLEVIGAIPHDLNGRYLRVGPNPKVGSAAHWFMGDGMIHGIELQGGRVNWYRNRFVKTPMLNKGAEATMTDLMSGLDHSLANTHIISHAGKLLALEELHWPFEMTNTLETVGAYNYDGKLGTGMTAHPKICAKNGELLFFSYGLIPPYMTYHRVSATGELIQSEPIDVKGATMVHDFNITENYVIFMDLPLVFDVANLGNAGLPIRWDEDYGARLGVMPRNGTNEDVVWYEIEPCYVFHPLNAYEDGGQIIIDVCRMEHHFKPGEPPANSYLYRWEIDQSKGKVKGQQLHSLGVAFPRLPDSLAGQPHQFGYFVESFKIEGENHPYGVAIQKFDFKSGEFTGSDLGKPMHCGEPVFVPREGGVEEDDGYLMFFAFDPAEDKSEFIILDARKIEQEPLARVKIPVRVPYGAHGSWIAD